jgi:hypothetical protein
MPHSSTLSFYLKMKTEPAYKTYISYIYMKYLHDNNEPQSQTYTTKSFVSVFTTADGPEQTWHVPYATRTTLNIN